MNEAEVSQSKEGLNVFWFLIHNGIRRLANSLEKAEQVKVLKYD